MSDDQPINIYDELRSIGDKINDFDIQVGKSIGKRIMSISMQRRHDDLDYLVIGFECGGCLKIWHDFICCETRYFVLPNDIHSILEEKLKAIELKNFKDSKNGDWSYTDEASLEIQTNSDTYNIMCYVDHTGEYGAINPEARFEEKSDE